MNSKKVNRLEVAKYYLKSELENIFSDDFSEQIESMINALAEDKVWRMLEALSFTYRLNGVFWKVSDLGISWRTEDVNIEDIILTGISPDVDKIIQSEKINRSPISFANYLKDLLLTKENISKELELFFPRKGIIKNKKVILIENHDNKKMILDGSHRLIAMILSGKKKVSAYIANVVGESKPRIGESTLWFLKEMYVQSSSKEDKEAILRVVKILAKKSSDGLDTINEYWIRHANEEFKQVGKKILSELK